MWTCLVPFSMAQSHKYLRESAPGQRSFSNGQAVLLVEVRSEEGRRHARAGRRQPASAGDVDAARRGSEAVDEGRRHEGRDEGLGREGVDAEEDDGDPRRKARWR